MRDAVIVPALRNPIGFGKPGKGVLSSVRKDPSATRYGLPTMR